MPEVLDPGRYYGTLVRARTRGPFTLRITRYSGGESVPVHAHRLPYVCFVVQGAYRERSGNADVGCDTGTVVVHAGGTRHSDLFDPVGGICLNVSWDGDGGAALLRRAGRALPSGSWCSARILDLGNELADAALSRSLPREAAVEKKMGELVEAVVDESARTTGEEEPAWLPRVEARLDEASTVRELARLAGVHRTTLLRGFWRHRGASVRGSIRSRRLDRAVDALLHSDEPLADIAFRCGFTDQSHLCRALRSAMGTSPGRARHASCVQEAADGTG